MICISSFVFRDSYLVLRASPSPCPLYLRKRGRERVRREIRNTLHAVTPYADTHYPRYPILNRRPITIKKIAMYSRLIVKTLTYELPLNL